jgi:hypothetical protein
MVSPNLQTQQAPVGTFYLTQPNLLVSPPWTGPPKSRDTNGPHPRPLPPRPHEVSKLANLSGPRWENLTQPFPTYGVSALDHPKADTLMGPAHDPSTQVTPVLKMVN